MVLVEETFDGRVLKGFFVWNVVVLKRPPDWFSAAQDQKVEFDHGSHVIRHARERLTREPSRFSRAERMIRDENQE